MDKIRFGPAGNAESFSAQGHKSTLEAPAWLAEMGLNAYEYQCGRGVRVSEETARKMGKLAQENDVRLSLHAPYYISMSSTDPEKRDASIGYILQSARAVRAMGGDRIVVHTGSCSKISREEALELAKDTMKNALQALDREGLGDVHICPEVMGKLGQLGTLEEVIALCRLDERLIPCVDFGHLNARTFGALRTTEDFCAVLDAMENGLGKARATAFHAHFSRIEYTEKGGEKRHVTFADTQWGPDFELLAQALVQKRAAPTIICESAGTQAEDAVQMQYIYAQYSKEREE